MSKHFVDFSSMSSIASVSKRNCVINQIADLTWRANAMIAVGRKDHAMLAVDEVQELVHYLRLEALKL